MEMKDMEKRTAKVRRETEPLDRSGKIYVAGHRGLVGSALVRRLEKDGFTNLITRTHAELDLTRQADVEAFFEQEKPEYVILAAAKVGGIYANDTYPADFIMKNLQIECNVIDAAYKNQVKKLLFLGSSCIYPRDCPQPIKEEYLLSGYLDQRSLCAGQNRRTEDVRLLQPPVRNPLYQRDALQPVRNQRQLCAGKLSRTAGSHAEIP